MASERVTPDTVSKAVDALLKWRRSQSQSEKPKLFDSDDEFVYLILTLKKIPQTSRVNPHKVPLPHSLLTPFSEQCLILDDRPNKARVTKAQAQSKIQSESIPIAKVLKLSKLTSDYRPFEAKRKLCGSYDLFFAEKSIVPLLPRLLGKSFFKKRKIPVPVDLKKGNWKEQVERACKSAMLFMRSGTCSVVRVAKLGMERDQIVENVVAAIQGVVEIVPKNWGNVRSLHLKLLESVALPVYQTVPDLKLKIQGVGVDGEVETVEKKKKRKKVEEKKENEDEGVVGDSGKKKKKKGRIHEVRYMDELEIENESGSDEGDASDDDDGELVKNKKRKKGGSSELSGVEQLKKMVLSELSANVEEKKKKKGEAGGKKRVKEGLIVGDEDSGVKKKKKGESGGKKGVKEGLIVGDEDSSVKKKKGESAGKKGVNERLIVGDEDSSVKKKRGDAKLKATKSVKSPKSVNAKKSKKVA